MTEQNEIKGLVENINRSFEDYKSEVGAIKGQLDALDIEKRDKQIDDLTKKLDTFQQRQAQLENTLNRGINVDQSDDAQAQERKEAVDKWLRDHKAGKAQADILTKDMQTNVNPDGGYLVRPELVNFIVGRVFETSPLRQFARVFQTGSKSVEVLIDDDEPASRWADEGAAAGNTSTPQLGLKEIPAHKHDAEPRISTEQIEDSFLDVEQWLQSKLAEKFSRAENAAFVGGNGVARPRGFLTYPDQNVSGTYERGTIQQVASGANGGIAADNLIDLQNSLKQEYQQRAVFGMNRTTYGELLKLKGNDQYFFGQTLLRDGQQQLQLLGRPVAFMDDMPEVSANNLSIVYADFTVAYTIIDRVGLQILRDPYSTHGFVTYYTTKRTGGDVTNFDAVKLMKIDNS